MPTLWALHNFWIARANPVVVVPPTIGGYPRWQSSVIAGSLLGALQTYYERFRYAWWWAWHAYRWNAAERRVMDQVVALMVHPAFALAQTAVRETAEAECFHDSRAWAVLGHKLKENIGTAENSWRHLHAITALSQAVAAQGVTLTNPQKNALVELAYLEFAAQPKRPRFPLYVT